MGNGTTAIPLLHRSELIVFLNAQIPELFVESGEVGVPRGLDAKHIYMSVIYCATSADQTNPPQRAPDVNAESWQKIE